MLSTTASIRQVKLFNIEDGYLLYKWKTETTLVTWPMEAQLNGGLQKNYLLGRKNVLQSGMSQQLEESQL